MFNTTCKAVHIHQRYKLFQFKEFIQEPVFEDPDMLLERSKYQNVDQSCYYTANEQ